MHDTNTILKGKIIMKNIMFIAIATLTIATSNAYGYNWNSRSDVKIVNNTNVTLEFRTEPGNDYLEVPANTTKYGVNVNSYGTYIGWGIDSHTDIPPVWAQDFDNNLATTGGTLSASTSNFQGDIWLGQVWAVGGIGYNDTLTIDGSAPATGPMYISITRTRGVVVKRGADNINAVGYVFCLNKGVVGFVSQNDFFRCPPDETEVVLANGNYIENLSWADPDYLRQEVYWACWGTGTGICATNSSPNTPGYYVYGIDSVAYSPQDNALFLNIPYQI